jgi:hypothetical protein
MQTTQKPINVVGGVYAALIFLLAIGLLFGLPIFAWILLTTGFIGFWTATHERRMEKARTDPRNARPWKK